MAAPVKITCPDIDKYIKYIKYVIMNDRDIKNSTHEDLIKYTIDMNDELNNCIGYLEELRSSNSSLRDWGVGLEEEMENAAAEISRLENNLEWQFQL